VENSEMTQKSNLKTLSTYSLFTELYRRLTSSAMQLIRLTNQEETPLSSYRIVKLGL